MTSSVNELADRIAALQDSSGCWNVLSPSDRNFPDLNYYAPNYSSTLWTLVLLADLLVDPHDSRFQKSLITISNHFFDEEHGIYTIGKSHFPIPCLNGNMIYLLSYFGSKEQSKIPRVVNFFNRYQRFDDGDFKTPSRSPYFSNRSCYGKHSCFWGVTKLLKGLVHMPIGSWDQASRELTEKAINFILLHNVCFSSHFPNEFIKNGIQYLTFPNMYRSDFLEVLWLLMKADVRSSAVSESIALLQRKMDQHGEWTVEKRISDLIAPLGKLGIDNSAITSRAREVLEFYEQREGS